MTKQMEELRDKLAEAAQVDDFKGNPNGYHVAPFVNADTVTDAFADGFDACYKEMAPVIEALRRIARDCSVKCDTAGELSCVYIADEALKNIGVE